MNELVRVSHYLTGEPHFGRGANSRFDDPRKSPRSGYGTCYLATDLTVAIAETLLHDEAPMRNGFHIAETEVLERHVIRFSGTASLVLADLAGPALKALVGSSELSTVVPYDIPQAWGLALHRHPQKVDGLLYMSRHVNDRKAIVVFGRAAAKLAGATSRPLIDEPRSACADGPAHPHPICVTRPALAMVSRVSFADLSAEDVGAREPGTGGAPDGIAVINGGSSWKSVGDFGGLQSFGFMQVRIFSRRYSSSRRPCAALDDTDFEPRTRV
ncbi:MAG TPA: RES family NAD+ phosphorylase [Burkholderiaceae bacterium]|nr:RES family NAD+ phosphorylase [Burkholderiaceae bacterium]